MQLIDENEQPINLKLDGDETRRVNRYYYEYDPKKNDIFLIKAGPMWYKTPKIRWYTLTIGNKNVSLPEHFYVMVGDILTSEVDWVRVDETFHRELSTYVYNSDLTPSTWVQEEMTCIHIDSDLHEAQLPFTKNVLPVMLGDNKAILVSEKDMYTHTKHHPFPQFF